MFLRSASNATENIPAEQQTAGKSPRLPSAHENPRRPAGAESQTRQGSQACCGRALLASLIALIRKNSFPKIFKLRNASEFQAVYKRGAKKISRSFVVFMLSNGLDHSRFGCTTPRKLGTANERNRIKRRVREIVRTSRDRIPFGFDVVVNPRRSVYEREYGELRSELLILLGAVL